MLRDGLLSVFSKQKKLLGSIASAIRLEDTHLKDQKRLEKLLAVIAIVFVWVYLIGEYEN